MPPYKSKLCDLEISNLRKLIITPGHMPIEGDKPIDPAYIQYPREIMSADSNVMEAGWGETEGTRYSCQDGFEDEANKAIKVTDVIKQNGSTGA